MPPATSGHKASSALPHATADRVVDPRNPPMLAERLPAAKLEMLDRLVEWNVVVCDG